MHETLSAEFLNRALDESGQGIVVTDHDGRILSVSPKILTLSGYTEKEIIGATPAIFKSGQTSPVVYQELWQTIRSGRAWSGAILNRRKNGTLFLDRESILRGVTSKGAGCYVAFHRDAGIELELRLSLSRAEARMGEKVNEIENAKSTIQTLVTLTSQQAENISHALITALESRDPYTAGHGRRTSVMMELVGAELGLFNEFSRDAIRMGAILHDIGKIGIPDGILLKPGPLTDPELDAMKCHPGIGFDIVSLALKEEESLRIVRHHHERLDGSGYPDGLRAHEIPDYVRAFSVCDAFDAMTSTRSYRPAMSAEGALSLLTDEALAGRIDMSAVKVVKSLSRNGVLRDACEISAAAA